MVDDNKVFVFVFVMVCSDFFELNMQNITIWEWPGDLGDCNFSQLDTLNGFFHIILISNIAYIFSDWIIPWTAIRISYNLVSLIISYATIAHAPHPSMESPLGVIREQGDWGKIRREQGGWDLSFGSKEQSKVCLVIIRREQERKIWREQKGKKEGSGENWQK